MVSAFIVGKHIKNIYFLSGWKKKLLAPIPPKRPYSLPYYLNAPFTKTVTSKVKKVWMQIVRGTCLLFNIGLRPRKQIPSLRRDFHTLSCWKKMLLNCLTHFIFFSYSVIYILWVNQVPFLFSFFIPFSCPLSPCSLFLFWILLLFLLWKACLCFSTAYFED